jgi:hypothetical protein
VLVEQPVDEVGHLAGVLGIDARGAGAEGGGVVAQARPHGAEVVGGGTDVRGQPAQPVGQVVGLAAFEPPVEHEVEERLALGCLARGTGGDEVAVVVAGRPDDRVELADHAVAAAFELVEDGREQERPVVGGELDGGAVALPVLGGGSGRRPRRRRPDRRAAPRRPRSGGRGWPRRRRAARGRVRDGALRARWRRRGRGSGCRGRWRPRGPPRARVSATGVLLRPRSAFSRWALPGDASRVRGGHAACCLPHGRGRPSGHARVEGAHVGAPSTVCGGSRRPRPSADAQSWLSDLAMPDLRFAAVLRWTTPLDAALSSSRAATA